MQQRNIKNAAELNDHNFRKNVCARISEHHKQNKTATMSSPHCCNGS